MIKRAFRLWAMSLGQKSGRTNREANIVALIRSMIALVYLITNIVIVAGVVRHWSG